MSISVSVLIPSKDRSHFLANCISGIIDSCSSYKIEEIILVDNCSIPEESEQYLEVSRIFNIKYCREPLVGLSRARNTGIRNANGEIIVFADDDFIVDRNWIKTIENNYQDSNVACCTGRMLSKRQDEASLLYERSGGFDRGIEKYRITDNDLQFRKLVANFSLIGRKRLGKLTPPPYNVGYGFCSFRRNVFDAVGLFDENLGRGTPALGSEDVDMYYRILRQGYTVVYEPEAVVFHEHRSTINAIEKDRYTAGVSERAFMDKYRKTDKYVQGLFWGNLAMLFSASVRAYIAFDNSLGKMCLAELKGFISGPKKQGHSFL